MATIKFTDGATLFRPRLICSLLSHRPILVRNIRAEDLDSPGLHEHEASFLRLLDKITNGTKIEINTTGTELRFFPGILTGGEYEHSCSELRGIGYFLEGIIALAPFGKEPLKIVFDGVTDGMEDLDPSADYFVHSVIPLFAKFGIGVDDGYPPPDIQIIRRGAAPAGGGRVSFYCPIVKELSEIHFTDFGKIKRVRGNAISCRINPSSSARVAHSAKRVFHRLLPDVWIHTDVHTASNKKNKGCGESPALKVCIWAETTSDVIICTETFHRDGKIRGKELPEDLGKRSAVMLLEEIQKGGCIDASAQNLAFIWMALGPEDVSRIRIGSLDHYTIGCLRLLKDFFDVEFKMKKTSDGGVLMSCLGCGYSNMARAST